MYIYRRFTVYATYTYRRVTVRKVSCTRCLRKMWRLGGQKGGGGWRVSEKERAIVCLCQCERKRVGLFLCQKRPTCTQRNQYVHKETCVQRERESYHGVVSEWEEKSRSLFMSKETYMYTTKPTCTQRDLRAHTETYMHTKRPKCTQRECYYGVVSVCEDKSRVIVAEYCSVLQCVAVRCSVLQCVAMCCSALQCCVSMRRQESYYGQCERERVCIYVCVCV